MGFENARQINIDGRAVTDLAVDLHVPTRLLDEAVHLAEAKAGALSGGFCGEKRLERFGQNICGHSCPGVADRDADILSGRNVGGRPAIAFIQYDIAGFNGELAALGHGIACVQGKIYDSGLRVSLIDLDKPDVTAANDLQVDFLAERALHELFNGKEQFARLDWLRRQWLTPRKCQE